MPFMRPVLLTLLVSLFFLPSRAETTLTASTPFGDAHPITKALKTFKSEIEKETAAGVKVSIVSTKNQDSVDITIRPLTAWRAGAPLAEVFELPFLFDARASQRAATRFDGPIRPTIDRQIASSGAHVLWWQSAGTAIIVAKRPTMAYPAAFKGSTLGVFANSELNWTKGIGAKPIVLHGPKALAALKADKVSALSLPVPAVTAATQLPNPLVVVLTRHVSAEQVVAIKASSWQKLTVAHRNRITAIAREIDNTMRLRTISSERRQLETLPQNATIIDFSPEDRAEWHAATKPTIDAFIKRTGKSGAALIKAARGLN